MATEAGKAEAKKEAGGFLHAYKPSEGYVTRLGAIITLSAFVAFACHRWYFGWPAIQDLLARLLKPIGVAFLVEWVDANPWYGKAISLGGAFLVGLAGFLVSYYYVYSKPKTAEFLIKTDGEMYKVSWPKYEPWFKPDTEVWGSTYVVLTVVVGLTLYIYGVDWLLQALARLVFYGV